jgi:hypothetical protein
MQARIDFKLQYSPSKVERMAIAKPHSTGSFISCYKMLLKIPVARQATYCTYGRKEMAVDWHQSSSSFVPGTVFHF